MNARKSAVWIKPLNWKARQMIMFLGPKKDGPKKDAGKKSRKGKSGKPQQAPKADSSES